MLICINPRWLPQKLRQPFFFLVFGPSLVISDIGNILYLEIIFLFCNFLKIVTFSMSICINERWSSLLFHFGSSKIAPINLIRWSSSIFYSINELSDIIEINHSHSSSKSCSDLFWTSTSAATISISCSRSSSFCLISKGLKELSPQAQIQ